MTLNIAWKIPSKLLLIIRLRVVTKWEVEEKGGEEFSGSETVIREGESRDIKWDNPDDRACGDTKKAEEVE
ncbi:hypothetical protein Tco_1237972 [Tanacetum coccineum]